MSSISPSTFSFLKKLAANNNREWFKSNKHLYDQAREEFIEFIDALIKNISKFDPEIAHHEAKDCVFRIYRDVRFSKDKSPYKTHLGAHITPAAKRSEIHSRAGYYIHLGPGESMLAGGAYQPQGSWLKGIRAEIAKNPQDLKKILKSATFKKFFGEMEGEQLKSSPRDYPSDHPEIELLKYKSFLASHRCKDKEVTSPGFLKHATKVFKALHPFDQFLNKAAS